MEHLAECHDVSGFAFSDNLVLAWDELVSIAVVLGFVVLFEYIGHLGAVGEDESHSTLEEDPLDHGDHLEGVGRKV